MTKKSFSEYMHKILEEKKSISLTEMLSEPKTGETLSFSEYVRSQLITESVNTHMTHVEDLVFEQGVDGTRKAINFFRDLRNALNGHVSSHHNITVKWDGAPAVWCGKDPVDGRFFVAKKSIFNKVPKVYKTPEEVKADTSGDLQTKLLLALKYLPEINPRGDIIQGDFMYDKSSLGSEKIDGEDYITFHPNTIVYAVPKNSKLGKRIQRSFIGIVWHTRYTGSSLDNISASFDANINDTLKYSQNVWSEDASFKDVAGTANFTKGEKKEVDNLLSSIGKEFQKMGPNVLNDIHRDNDLLSIVKIYMNARIRDGKRLGSPRQIAKELQEYTRERLQKEVDKVKREDTKIKRIEQMQRVMKYFDTYGSEVSSVFRLVVMLSKLKMIFVEKLNSASSISTFLKTENGYKVTQQEGFVAIDRTKSGAVKLVDRLEFSKANFSKEFLKGWQ